MDRPGNPNFSASDPESVVTIRLLGGFIHHGVVFSRDQVKALAKVYGFTDVFPEGPADMERAGNQRNLMRQAQTDGLRLMGFIAKWVEAGHDPVKLFIQLATEAGYDTCGVTEWACDELEDVG